MKRIYENNKIVVFWDSDICRHSGKCIAQLPDVFDPDRHPWIDIDKAAPEAIKRAIDNCPSGALTCKLHG